VVFEQDMKKGRKKVGESH